MLCEEELKQVVLGMVFAPLICAVLWFYCAVGTAWEEQVRCENGATQFCVKGE